MSIRVGLVELQSDHALRPRFPFLIRDLPPPRGTDMLQQEGDPNNGSANCGTLVAALVRDIDSSHQRIGYDRPDASLPPGHTSLLPRGEERTEACWLVMRCAPPHFPSRYSPIFSTDRLQATVPRNLVRAGLCRAYMCKTLSGTCTRGLVRSALLYVEILTDC